MAAVKEFKAAEAAGKTAGARLGSAFKTLAKVMKIVFIVGAAAATYAMGKFFVSSIKSAAQFEQKMAMVKSVTNANAKEFEALGKKAKQLGKDTKFTMISIGEGMEALGRAGLTANEIISSMAGVTALAASQSIELGQAAEMTAGALNGFNLAADQAGRVADVYAYAASNSAIRTEDLAETFKYAMPAANALGYSIEDVAGMTMLLGDNMVKGSMAGTSLSFAFSELVAMSDEFQQKLGDVGVSVSDLTGPDGKLLSMAEILGVLKAKGLDAGDMFELFGKRAGKGMAILLDKGEDAIKDYTDALEECGGTAEEMAEIQLDTLSGQVEILRGSWELLKVTVGEKLMPILKNFLKETIIPLVNKMVDWAKKSDTLEKGFKSFIDKVKNGIDWIVEHRESLVKAVKAVTVAFAALVAIKVASWIAGVVTGLTGPVGLIAALALAEIALIRFLKEKYVVTVSEAYERAAEGAAALKDALENLTPNMTAAFVMEGDLAGETGRMNEELERSEEAANKMGGTVLQAGHKASTAYLKMKEAIDEWRASQKAGNEEVKTGWAALWDSMKEHVKEFCEGVKGLLTSHLATTLIAWSNMRKGNEEAAKEHADNVLEIEREMADQEGEILSERAEAYRNLAEAYLEDAVVKGTFDEEKAVIDGEAEAREDAALARKKARMEELEALYEQEAITQEEYSERKKQILADYDTAVEASRDRQVAAEAALAARVEEYEAKKKEVDDKAAKRLSGALAAKTKQVADLTTLYLSDSISKEEYDTRKAVIEAEYDKAVAEAVHNQELGYLDLATAYSDDEAARAEYVQKKENAENEYQLQLDAVAADEKARLDQEAIDYEEQRKTVWGILQQGVRDFLSALKEKLLLKAAEEGILATAAAFLLNFVEAGKHALAAATYLAGGMGLAIAGFQKGGIVTEPTLAVLGEKNIPEAVIPLTSRNLSTFGQGQLAYAGAGGGGQTTIEDGAIRIAEGATFYVREEADIERIAKELGDEFDDRIIGKGRVSP